MGKTMAAWLLVASAMASTAASPRDVVQAGVTRIMQTLEASGQATASEPARREAVERLVEIRRVARGLFDFDGIARRTLSRHWAARTAEEQAEFTRMFTELLERAWLGRIETYAGEQIVWGNEVVDGGFATVRSRVVTKRRSETPVDYRMHVRDGRWQVYDVLIDGVSFVATYRSQFDRIITSESYGALVERMRRQAVGSTAFGGRAHGL
jgi:phospholipid transport system substrate-binding protein